MGVAGPRSTLGKAGDNRERRGTPTVFATFGSLAGFVCVHCLTQGVYCLHVSAFMLWKALQPLWGGHNNAVVGLCGVWLQLLLSLSLLHCFGFPFVLPSTTFVRQRL